MSKSWAEVKKLLDDPYVDADTKEHLFAAYLREGGYATSYDSAGYNQGYQRGPFYVNDDRLPPEVRDYYKKYKLDNGDYEQGNLDKTYEDAQAESEERGYSNKLNDQTVENGRKSIEGMQPPIEGATSGVRKSNEIFDLAKPALKLWEDFLPVNDKVPSDTLGRYGKINLENDIKKRFDEQVGISFKNFLDDARRLRDAYTQLNTLNTDTQTELNKVYKDWSGPA
ncbi:MAG: hypothetical protein ACJ73U_23275, partial [Actinophytocola sp.]